MSSAKQRSESPRRRATGMHPGWACFLAAFGSGIFGAFAMLATVQWAMMQQPFWLVGALTCIWMALFIIGGKKAEKLWERP